MASIEDRLWLGWGRNFIDIVDGIGLRALDIEHGKNRLTCYQETENKELLQIIVHRSNDDLIMINLYGSDRSASPVAASELRGEEVILGMRGSMRRFDAKAAPDIIDFLKRMRAKAMELAPPSNSQSSKGD